MKRTYRLRQPEQFQRVRREGRVWESSLLSLNVASSRRRISRCGFVVSKRIGAAVERNRAKRRVREAIRLVYHQIMPHWDLVFVIRSSTITMVPFEQIQHTVEQLLRRAGVWREPSTSS
jgi:ribonuclease P protein component